MNMKKIAKIKDESSEVNLIIDNLIVQFQAHIGQL